MRKITNIKVPQPEKSEDEKNLFSLVLDEHGIILSIDKTCKKESSYDEDWHGDWLSPRAIDLCLLYTSPSQRDRTRSRMPSSA